MQSVKLVEIQHQAGLVDWNDSGEIGGIFVLSSSQNKFSGGGIQLSLKHITHHKKDTKWVLFPSFRYFLLSLEFL